MTETKIIVSPRKGCETILTPLSVCLCICVSTSIDFLCNRLSDQCETLNIGGTPHGDYFIDSSDIIGHMVWQPYWIKRGGGGETNWKSPKPFNEKKLKLALSHHPIITHGELITFMSSVKWYSSHNWLNQHPYLKNLKLQIYDL